MSRATALITVLQILSSTGEEKAAAVAIGVDVSDGMFAQFIDVRLHPFCGTEQAWLFAVPGAIDDGALGIPSLLVQFAQHASFFELGDMPARGSSAPFTQAS